MLYTLFYKNNSIRKVSKFLNPPIILGKEFELPRESALHYINGNASMGSPSITLPYFNNIKSSIYHILEYQGDIIGNPRIRNREKTIFANLKKDREFKQIPYKANKVTVKSKDLFVYNYGSLVDNYKYSFNKMNTYYRYKNMMNTVCKNIKDIGRHHFINIDVPDEIVSRTTLDKHLGPVTNNTLNIINNFELFLLLDIWKLLHPDYREVSSFYNIKENMIDKVHFIFNFNNKLVVIKLNYLLGLVMDYKLKTADTQLSDTMVRKLVLNIYLQLIHMSTGVDIGVKGISEADFNQITNTDMDDLLDNFKYKKDDTSEEELDDEFTDTETVSIDPTKLFTREYKNIDSVYADEVDKFTVNDKELEELFSSNLISKLDYTKAVNTLESQKNYTSPYDNNTPLLESLKYNKVDFEITDKEIILPDSYTTLDKTMLKDTQSVLNEKYIKKTYKKDIVNTVYSIQKAGIYVDDYKIEEEESILGVIEHHTISVKPIDGKPSTIRFRLPKIHEDGTYYMSGNRYIMRKQRTDKPIRKIDSLKVALSTAYGKSFITKATYKKDDVGFWFQKQLTTLAIDNKVTNIVSMSTSTPDVKLPTDYTTIARYTKSFNYGNIHLYFGYTDRSSLVPKDKLSKIEGNKYVVIGKDRGNVYVMDFNNKIYKYNGKYTELSSIYDMITMDVSNKPVEYSNIKIFKKHIPVGILMSYYLGFDKFIQTLNAKYTVYDKREKPIIEPHEYVVTFNDYTYVFDRREMLNSLLIGGLTSINKILKKISKDTLNKKEDFSLVFTEIIPERLDVYMNEFPLLETMFVDEVSVTVLKEMKEPTTFKGLLLRATELLMTEYYPHPNSIEGSVIKGYERVSAMLYNETIKSIRTYKQKSNFNKSKLDMSPFAVWNMIGDDSTTMIVDDLNPLAAIKQTEDITFTGMGGRTGTTMNKASRAWHPSEIGIVGEGSKDSGDVGTSAYMSANPKVKNTRGFVEDFNFKKDGWTSILTTNGNMTAELIKDDPKRSTVGLLIR